MVFQGLGLCQQVANKGRVTGQKFGESELSCHAVHKVPQPGIVRGRINGLITWGHQVTFVASAPPLAQVFFIGSHPDTPCSAEWTSVNGLPFYTDRESLQYIEVLLLSTHM